MTQSSSLSNDTRIIIVGAGFAGIYLLYRLRKAGFTNATILEAGTGPGGTWHWNRYPDARVDSDVPVYELDIPELYNEWSWSERFPGREELERYFKFVVEKLDLERDIRYSCTVTGAKWEGNKWVIDVNNGEESIEAKVLLLAPGIAAKPYLPDIPGMNTFLGEQHHTAYWPSDRDVELKGKRVGIVGTGASAVQVIQEIGPSVSHLTIFQRTPNLAVPMRQTKLTPQAQAVKKAEYPAIMANRLSTFAGFDWTFMPTQTPSGNSPESKEERDQVYQRLWNQGGLTYWLATYEDLCFVQEANDHAYNFWRENVQTRITDPEKAKLLAPVKAPHGFGTKRPSLEQNYYEVLNLPHIHIHDLNKSSIKCVTPTGITSSDGTKYEFDVIIYATGFDAITGCYLKMNLNGANGVTLNETWKEGILTNFGLSTSSLPNAFFIYGPQAPTNFANGPSCHEIQVSWIVDTLSYLRDNHISTITAKSEAEVEWSEKVKALWESSLFPGTKSWWQGDNVPGKKREALGFIGGLPEYKRLLDECKSQGYSGFVLK